MPLDLTLRVWDCVLYEGSLVHFRFSMALLQSCEDELTQVSSESFTYVCA